MNLISTLALLASCFWLGTPGAACVQDKAATQLVAIGPQFTGNSIDVAISADAYIVWDVKTGKVLKEKAANEKRPVASLSKLATVLLVQDVLSPGQTVEIPQEAARAQRLGANIKLPVGEHAYVKDLLAASLIPSANDAAVTLAAAAKGSEEDFVKFANTELPRLGFANTKLGNATGLQGGDQYSTAQDIKGLLMHAYKDPVTGPLLAQGKGSLTTVEGKTREYVTTNKLLGTYLPVLAAKTGYTTQAKENLALVTRGAQGQELGVVLLGSDDRFQNMKVLVEWIWRNYTWL
ncbi:MAG: D-alanyl-D-alanine carboxypeptidase [Candidatus Andersenbacteria bacterium]|nr:D-alanyl-D-alanine carboxypeptidase [Candidatus Andersenbacteria bacterium]